MNPLYALVYDEHTGALAGAVRAGTVFVPRSSPAWAEVVAWAAAQVPPVDLSDLPPPSAAERLNVVRWAALMGLTSRADEIGIAVRAVLAGLSSGINDRLELIDAQLRALGAPGIPPPVRVLEAEVLAYLMQNPTAGDPLPPPEP